MDDSDQQAEFDAMLIEYAGDILPSLATAVGGAAFAPYFAGFLPLLLKKTVSKRADFKRSSKVIRFCFITLFDWLRMLTLLEVKS